MSELAAPEFVPETLEVDSLLPEDKSVIRCKCVPLRKMGAEFIGTFFIVLCGVAGPIVNQKYGGIETLTGHVACIGIAITIIVSSAGHVSGAHLNPLATIGFAVTRHFPWIQVPGYIAAQVVGSMCASYVLKGVFHPFANGGVTLPSVNIAQASALEFLATFLVMFVIMAVATGSRAVIGANFSKLMSNQLAMYSRKIIVGDLAGIAIGAIVLLDILVAGIWTGAFMNPARTLGLAIAAGNYRGWWMYMVAPPLGAIAGAVTYSAVKLRG